MARTVLLPVDDNRGYSPEQIETYVTLQDLLESVEQAIEQFGADAKVVVSNGQQYGAGFGRLQAMGAEVIISDANPDEEDHDANDLRHHLINDEDWSSEEVEALLKVTGTKARTEDEWIDAIEDFHAGR